MVSGIVDTDRIDLERTLGEMLASNTDLSPDEIANYTSNIQIVDDARMPYADDRPIDLLLNGSGGIAPEYAVMYTTNLVNCWKA